MARITNRERFNFNTDELNEHRFIKVGNNREIRKYWHEVSGNPRVAGYLHRNNIICIEKVAPDRVEVYLTTCGYMTTTTRSAMNDFLKAMGLKARVSFAGGVMSVRYDDKYTTKRKEQNLLGTLLFTMHYEGQPIAA